MMVRRRPSSPRAPRATNRIYTEADQWFWASTRQLFAPSELRFPYKQHAWIYSATSAKATNFASAPALIVRGNAADRSDRGIPVGDLDPWQELFDSPNPCMTGKELREAFSIHLDLYGEVIWILRQNNGHYDLTNPTKPPTSIWPVNPTLMEEHAEAGAIVSWETKGKNTLKFPASTVLHFKLHNPYNPLRGLSPLEAAMQGASTDYKAGQFTEALMDNGADPGGILTTDLNLSRDQVTSIRTQFEDRHSGPGKSGKIAVLSGGLRYERTVVTHRDMEFSAQRKWSREEILAVLRVPKLEVGLVDDINRTTAHTTRRLFWQNVLIPRLEMMQDVLWSKLFRPLAKSGRTPRNTVWLRFDLSAIEALKEDFQEKVEQGKGLQSLGYGVNAINERLALDMPEVEWGDEPLVSAQQVPISYVYDNPGFFLQPNQPTQEGFRRSLPPQPSPRKKDARAQWRRQWAEVYFRDFWHPEEQRILAGVRSYYSRMKVAQLAALERWLADHPGRKAEPPLTPQELEDILLVPQRWGGTMQTAVGARLLVAAQSTLQQLSNELGGFSVISPDVEDPWVREQVFRRVAGMVKLATEDRNLLRQVLLRAMSEGTVSDIRGIQTTISGTFNAMRAGRSLAIARTETGMLTNGIRYRAMQREKIEKHEWVSAGDKHVRPADNPNAAADHVDLDGMVVPVGEPFPSKATPAGLLYPMDQNASAADVVNCRCAAVPVTS